MSQVLTTALLLGIIFELPVILFIAVKKGLIKLESIINKHIYIVAGVIIVATLLPPTDFISLVLISLPLVILFELTVFLLKKTAKKRR